MFITRSVTFVQRHVARLKKGINEPHRTFQKKASYEAADTFRADVKN